MHKIRVGVACLGRTTFDVQAARELFSKTIIQLQDIPEVDWIIEKDLIIEIADAEAAVRKFNASQLDGLIVISGTFHLGHLALIFNREISKPLMLWAYNELPYNGGKIRLNSVCGVNLNASNLYKAGNDTYFCHIGDEINMEWLTSVRMKAALHGARIGLVGSRAHGFFNLAADELRVLNESGTMIDYYSPTELWDAQPDKKISAEMQKSVTSKFDCSGVSPEQVAKVADLAAILKEFYNKNNLSALAIRCWPEFAAQYGISPCAAMSLLQSDDYLLACEGDAEGAMSMLACRAAGAKTPFLADLSQVNLAEDFALMWHCGVAPVNLWDGVCQCSLDTYFAGGKGVTADFAMKSGEVSLLRIDSARGQTRLFMAHGQAENIDKNLKGTYAKVTFDKPLKQLLDTVVYNGIAHHVSMVYANHLNAYRIFARLMKWQVIE